MRLTFSSLTTTSSLSRTSSSETAASIPKKRGNYSRSAQRWYCVIPIFGRISSSKPRTKRSDNIVKSTLRMPGRTRPLVHHHWVVYELETGPKTLTRKDHYSATRSRIPKRRNVQLVRPGCPAYGGELRGVSQEMPCARTAGKSSIMSVVDDSADYRKYGVISFTKSEDSKKPEKIENKAKKQKVSQKTRLWV